MDTKELEEKIAHLESVNDQLITEIKYIDDLMTNIGFSNGLISLKLVACDILNNNEIIE